MRSDFEKAVRNRLLHSLSPENAASIEVSISALQQIAMGTVALEPWQLTTLAKRLNIQETA